MAESFPPKDYISTESAIEGIQVYKPAPSKSETHKEIIDFTCPQCGATTGFSTIEGGIKCGHCGYYEAPPEVKIGKSAEEFEFTVETMERAAQGWGIERKDLTCQNCSALTSVPVESLTHTCPFCGSNKVIQRQDPKEVLRPRFLIPFKFDDQNCKEIAKRWLGSSWMTPSGLKNSVALANFNPVFLPFWTFDAVTSANWKAEVGHSETKRYFEDGEWKERTVVVWRWENGQVRMNIDDLLVSGTERMSKSLIARIQDFDLRELVPYDPKYLAGMQAQAFDLPLEKAWEMGRHRMREQTREACLSQASTSRVRNFSMSLDFAQESWRYLLVPTFINTYAYEKKSFQVMINGQKGTIAGQRPVDWTKIWLVIAALLSPGVLVSLIGIATVVFAGIGLGIGGIGFVFLLIGLAISALILVQASKMDDV